MPDSDSADTFEIVSTLDDQAAFLLYRSRRPYRLALQVAIFVGIGLGFVLLQLALGLMGAVLASKGAASTAMRAYLAKGFGEDLVTLAPWGIAFLTLMFCLNIVVFVPRQCRSIAKRLTAGLPARTLESGTQLFPSHLRLDERGVESWTAEERVFIAWPLVQRVVETKRQIFLMIGNTNAFVIATSGLDAASGQRLRDTIDRQLARPDGIDHG